MLKLEKSDIAVNDITRHIACDFFNKGYEFSEKFIRFLIFSITLNPEHNFTVQREREDDELRNLTNEISKLLLRSTPSLETLKIQSFVFNEFGNRENTLNNHHDMIFKHSAEFIRSIIEALPQSQTDFKTLRRKIVLATVLLSGLGDPSNPSVFNEASVAMDSIFNEQDIRKFVTLTPESKMIQLKDLTKIVAGIRIFNKNRGKGGVGIENLTVILERACDVLLNNLETSLTSFEHQRKKLLIMFQELCHWDEEIEDLLLPETPSGLSEQQFSFAKEFLCLKQQICSFSRRWIENIKNYRNQLYATEASIEGRLFRLTEDVKYRIAVPTRQVYPQFLDLSECWSLLQDLTVLLSTHHTLYLRLVEFHKEHDFMPEFLMTILSRIVVPDKEESEDCLCQAKKIKIKPKIDPSKVVCEVVYKTDFPENLSLQYCGFCPVHIVEGDGIVLDVDTEIGLLHYEGKYYGFSCEKAAYNFGKNPGFYKKAVLDYARRNPEYLDLLDLRQEAFEYRFVGNLVPKFPKRISERTKEVQCVDHPYEDYIDKKYEWNIWELKRDAVQLANILKCKTHSTQTDRSHFKEGVGTQTHFKREVACQTMRDSYTNVPKPSTFIFGLRGRRKEDQHKILLTRPVDEGPCKILERNIPSPCEFKEE